MHWVYVLRSSTTGNIYVGETTRLFKRWGQHANGECKTTRTDDYDTVIGIYSVSHNYAYMCNRDRMLEGYDAWKCKKYWDSDEDKQKALFLEKHIVERYMTDRGILYQKIKGWFYLDNMKCAGFCFGDGKREYKRDRPLCHCSYPCEINMTKDKAKLYFSCPIPTWIEGPEIPDRCNFYQEFTPYKTIMDSYNPFLPPASEIFEDES